MTTPSQRLVDALRTLQDVDWAKDDGTTETATARLHARSIRTSGAGMQAAHHYKRELDPAHTEPAA